MIRRGKNSPTLEYEDFEIPCENWRKHFEIPYKNKQKHFEIPILHPRVACLHESPRSIPFFHYGIAAAIFNTIVNDGSETSLFIILLNPTVSHNHFIFFSFFDEVGEALLKFLGAVACRVDIGDADVLVGGSEMVEMRPRFGVFADFRQDVFRENVGFLDDGQNRRPDFRVDESLLLEPDQALDVGARVAAALATRREASGVVRAVECAGHPVNPAEAEGLLHGVVVGDALLTRIYGGEDEPYFRLRLEVLGEPLAPLGAAVSAEGLHRILVEVCKKT